MREGGVTHRWGRNRRSTTAETCAVNVLAPPSAAEFTIGRERSPTAVARAGPLAQQPALPLHAQQGCHPLSVSRGGVAVYPCTGTATARRAAVSLVSLSLVVGRRRPQAPGEVLDVIPPVLILLHILRPS